MSEQRHREIESLPDDPAARHEARELRFDPKIRSLEEEADEYGKKLEQEAPDTRRIDELLERYSTALKETKAHPDDPALVAAAKVARSELVKANLLQVKFEEALPAALAKAQAQGDRRFERAQRARSKRAEAREARADDQLSRKRSEMFFEFLGMFQQAMRQVEENIQQLPPDKRSQFRSSLNEICRREEEYISGLAREGVDFEWLSRHPADLDSDSWKDYVARMQQYAIEMIELNNDIRDTLHGHQQS